MTVLHLLKALLMMVVMPIQKIGNLDEAVPKVTFE